LLIVGEPSEMTPVTRLPSTQSPRPHELAQGVSRIEQAQQQARSQARRLDGAELTGVAALRPTMALIWLEQAHDRSALLT
jgi:hypothetical protein